METVVAGDGPADVSKSQNAWGLVEPGRSCGGSRTFILGAVRHH